MSRDLTDVMFDFTMPFEINDDNSILKRLQLYVHFTFRNQLTVRQPFHSPVPFFISYTFAVISLFHGSNHLMCLSSMQYCRHRTNHQVLRKMLPDHIYQYCVANHLLDQMVVETANDDDDDEIMDHQVRRCALSTLQTNSATTAATIT
jgi:hypothetical protein